MLVSYLYILSGVFPGGSVVKNPLSNAGDSCSIPRLEDPLEKETVTHFSILAWEIPWTEEPGRLQSMGSKKSDMTYQLTTTTYLLWRNVYSNPLSISQLGFLFIVAL